MTDTQKNSIKNLGEELAQLLITMSDSDKNIALAMMQGMIVGKQIASTLADTKKA